MSPPWQISVHEHRTAEVSVSLFFTWPCAKSKGLKCVHYAAWLRRPKYDVVGAQLTQRLAVGCHDSHIAVSTHTHSLWVRCASTTVLRHTLWCYGHGRTVFAGPWLRFSQVPLHLYSTVSLRTRASAPCQVAHTEAAPRDTHQRRPYGEWRYHGT